MKTRNFLHGHYITTGHLLMSPNIISSVDYSIAYIYKYSQIK